MKLDLKSHSTLTTYLGTLLVSLTGCATIGQRAPVNEDQVVQLNPVEVPLQGAVAEVKQSGTELSLTISHVCDMRNDRVVHRTTRTESFNGSPRTDWWLAGGALASAGVGVGLIADTDNTYSNDRASRTYNPVGPDNERVVGFGLIGVSAVLATIATVDVVRANATRVDRQALTLPGEFEQRAVPCKSRPHAHARVMARLERREFALGDAGADGRLEVDLDQVLPTEWALPSLASRIELRVGGRVAGSAGIKPLFLRREAREFERSGLGACKDPTSPDACQGVQAFLERYPDGPHNAQARAVLVAAAPKLAVVKDDVYWSALRPEECANSSAGDPALILAACQPLRAYLDQFPRGQHSQEAQSALASGEHKVEQLTAKIERAAAPQAAAKAAQKRRLTDAQIKQILIRESIAEYPGPCPCPYNTARNGSSCGGRSAYSRPGGYEPLCYPGDVSAAMVQSYRESHSDE